MLSFEIMGLFALAVFWTSMILIAADVWLEIKDVLALGKLARAARRVKIVRGDADGAIATFGGTQAGHALDGKPAIDLSHAELEGTVHGGVLRDGDEEIELGAARMRVWVDEKAFMTSGDARPDDLQGAFERAATPRGYERELAVSIREGDEAFYVPGELLASIDPRAIVRRHLAVLTSYGLAHLAIAGAVTAVALSAPMDTWTAKIGGAGCVAWFLLSPAILRSVRASTRTPDQARRFWRWNVA